MQEWSDFATLVTDRHVKLQFLERLQISGKIHHKYVVIEKTMVFQ